MSTTDNYRYPGSRPFQDTDYDRRLFFGREEETQALLHLVLAEKLVVLFGKSGMGKTSLLNAGLCQLLRERSFMPLPIRFNVPEIDPLRAVFTGIQDLAAQQQFEYTPGPATTLWEYFQTAEFWSDQDTLLTPVLILDQFEDFFDFHAEAQRLSLIAQLAELLSDRVPQIKIMLAIREDYLGQLEEMARAIPAILQNRFRLAALTRKQAQEAIINPAHVQAETIHTNSFGYAPEAVEAMLNFLCKRKERDKTVMTNEVEPFQLQLLCQDLEAKIQAQQKTTVQPGDLGGESGMQKVLQNFYDRQLKRIRSRKRRRVRKLCEKGLLSQSNRRLSLEEEDITRRFKVKKPLLNDLVNSRLLRAEPRVGSTYYELCHDTLVVPIRKSQRIYNIKTRTFNVIGIILMVFIALFSVDALLKSYIIVKGIKTCLAIPEQVFALGYNVLGNALGRLGKYGEAVGQYQKAIELDPNYFGAHYNLGWTLYQQGKFDEAMIQYRKAIELNPRHPLGYLGLGIVFYNLEQYDKGISQFQKAIELEAKEDGYVMLGNTFNKQGKYGEAVAQYRKALENNPDNSRSYVSLGEIFFKQGKYDDAITQCRQALALNQKYWYTYVLLGNALKAQGQSAEVIRHYQKAIELAPERGYAYQRLGDVAYTQGKFDEAWQFYRKSYDLEEKRYQHFPEGIGAKMQFAERSLTVERAEQAFMLADEVLKKQIFSSAQRLATRFIAVTSLLYQQKRPEALTELQALFDYYRSLTEYNEKYWDYETLHNVISMSQKLSDADKTLLLKLIDLLESPKPEGEKKIEELENLIVNELKQ